MVCLCFSSDFFWPKSLFWFFHFLVPPSWISDACFSALCEEASYQASGASESVCDLLWSLFSIRSPPADQTLRPLLLGAVDYFCSIRTADYSLRSDFAIYFPELTALFCCSLPAFYYSVLPVPFSRYSNFELFHLPYLSCHSRNLQDKWILANRHTGGNHHR